MTPLPPDKVPDRDPATYADAGVDDAAAERAIKAFTHHLRSTFRPEVVTDVGSFGAIWDFDAAAYEDPMLVSSTDGAGTKVLIAQQMGVHNTIGIDLVAMSVNDVAAMGAEPLFFLDYILVEKIEEKVIEDIVGGIAHGCRDAGCSLVGGEIAQHPGHVSPGSYDLAGFCVGVVDRKNIIDGSRITPGDVVIGIASSGLHSNGYSLVRKVLFEQMGHKMEDRPPGLSNTLGEELLRPTLIYARMVLELTSQVSVKGLAHITAGGIPGNLARILPEGVSAVISGNPDLPPIFEFIQSLGRIERKEMFSSFNMGVGMTAVVDADDANHALDVIRSTGHHAFELGLIHASDLAPNSGDSDARVRIQ